MRRLVLISNPVASGFTASLHREVVAILTGPFDVTPVWPPTPGEARRAAAEAAADGYDVVVAMGGDGVIHQVAGGLVGTTSALGIVPAGTTNVLARLTGAPGRPREAAETLAAFRNVRPVTVGRIESDSPLGAQVEVVTFGAGVGFDAAVVELAERTPLSKVSFGALHYARSALRVVLTDYRRRPAHLRVASGERGADAVAVLFQLHDRFTFFGPLGLRLGGTSGTGPLVVVARRLTTVRLLRLVARAARGADLSKVPGVEVWHDVDLLTVEADPVAWVEADGELLGKASRIEISIEDRPLLVVDQTRREQPRRFRRR
jgi:diacylglycerol kinase family enzyme